MIDIDIINKHEKNLAENFAELEDIALFNQQKVLNAFQKNKIALRHFNGTNGYGYDDEGRDKLNQLLADIFKAEKAICSPSIVSGTHALSLCLYGVLRPNDVAISITGKPYDSLLDVVYGKDNDSLEDFGIDFKIIDFKNDDFNYELIKEYLLKYNPKMIYLQRSRGYAWRPALSIGRIEKVVKFLKALNFNGCIMLDNCYGEFVDKKEAIEVGVNLLAGSLIKNIGAGIIPTGGYVVGDEKYVNKVQNRLTAPSIAGEVGSYAYGYQYYYQGLFLAPHAVLQALKGVMLFSSVLSEFNCEVMPNPKEKPNDIITSIMFNNQDNMINFIKNIQYNSPIDSFVDPIPSEMPGYNDKVIMAAGCFVQGSSLELSADGPVRPPYIAYMQGGLTYEHCKIALMNMKI